MTPEHTDMTGAARLREALEYLLGANTLVFEAEGCQCAVCRAVRFAREALAAVPEAPEPAPKDSPPLSQSEGLEA